MRGIRVLSCVGLIAAAILTVGACGGKPPASPSPPSNDQVYTPGPLASVPVYVGAVGLPDGSSGTVMLRPSASFSAVSSVSPPLIDVIVAVVEAPLHAQGSPASGQLLLPGDVVSLAGTFSGSTFDVTGGGYTVTATTSGTSLSGSGTGPDGTSLFVTPPAPPPPASAPAPSDASGEYRGTYSILAPAYWRSTSVNTGVLQEDCSFSTRIIGTLTLQLQSTGAGTYAARLLDEWRESDGPAGSCSPRLANTPDPFTEFNGQTLSPSGPTQNEAAVSANLLQIGWTSSGEQNGGIHARTGVFTGALSGSSVTARYTRGRSWNRPRGEFLYSTQGYQGSVDVTLLKQ